MSATTSTEKSVLILGSNGRVGLAVAQAFAAAEWRVYAQIRRDAAVGMPSSAVLVRVPLESTDALVAQARGVSVVVYAVNPVYTAWSREALPGLRQGIAVAAALGARLLFPGNVYNFGSGMPAVLGASTLEHPTTRKGRIRVEMELELSRAADAAAAGRPGGCRSTVIRAGDFFGGGTGNWFDLAIAKDISKGSIVWPGRRVDVPHAWAYLPDLAKVFVAVAAVPERRESASRAPFERLHFAGHTATGAELLEALEAAGSAVCRPAPASWRRGGLPWGLMRLGSLCDPMLRELLEMRYLWDTPHALDGAPLRSLLGREPEQTPFRSAVELAVRSLHTA